MRIGAAAALGRTFWEYLECVQEVGIKYVEIPCDIGYWKPIGALGYTPDNILSLWPAQAMHSFPPEYVEPSTGRPSLEAKEKIESYGITTAGFYVKNDFLYTDPVKRDNEVKKIKELLRIANKWGTVETLRIHGGEATNTNVWQLSLEKCIELIIDGIQKSAKYAQEYGVALALENHYLVLQDPDNLMRIYNEVSSDWFGFNVDTGNFHAYGYRPEKLKETFKLLAPYTKTTHMKDGRMFPEFAEKGPLGRIGYWEDCTLGMGDVPIKFFVDELKKCSYKGLINVHTTDSDPKISPFECLKKSYEYLESLV